MKSVGSQLQIYLNFFKKRLLEVQLLLLYICFKMKNVLLLERIGAKLDHAEIERV